jgi:hypothetical protein
MNAHSNAAHFALANPGHPVPSKSKQDTPFGAAVAALRLIEAEAKKLSEAADAAEEALELACESREVVPTPPILTVKDAPITLICEGRSAETDPQPYTWRSVSEISERFHGERGAAMITACVDWEFEQAEADRRTGYDKAAKAARDAHARYMRRYFQAERAAEAVLKAPTTVPSELKFKRKLVRKYFGGEDTAVDALLVAARADVPSSPVSPASPAPTASDPTAEAYRTARRQMGEYAHGVGVAQEDVDDFPVADAMLTTQPVDIAGVATRLGRILSEAFVNSAGDWDCPHCVAKRQAITPATSKELCGAGEGDNGGGDALFRALANLHLQVEALAQQGQRAVSLSQGCLEAREAFLTAQASYNAMEDQESVEGNQAFLDLTRAELTYAQTPPADIHQLRTQMTDVINFDGLPGSDGDVEDAASIQELLDDDEAPINYLAIAYQHISRLTGVTGAFLDARRALPEHREETDAEFDARISLPCDPAPTPPAGSATA